VHQGILEIDAVSHEVTGNSQAGELEGGVKYATDEFLVSPVVEAKIKKPTDHRDVTFLEEALVGRRSELESKSWFTPVSLVADGDKLGSYVNANVLSQVQMS
jgi:hypothetical protein